MTKTPRSDEYNALTALIKYLQDRQYDIQPSNIIYEPNGRKTAPDYAIDFGQKPVLVEVKNSGDGFLVMPNGKSVTKRELYESSAFGIFAKIESHVKSWINQSETIVLSILSPIPLKQRGLLAKKIAKVLENAYKSKLLVIEKTTTFKVNCLDKEIQSITIEAKLTQYYKNKKEYSPLEGILAATLNSSALVLQMSLSEQARYILVNAIEEKRKKLAHLAGEKWLVIINNNSLLDFSLYSSAHKDLLCSSCFYNTGFAKVFIVDGDSASELDPNI